MLPKPSGKISVIAAGQSPRGVAFASEFADFNFTSGEGINTPTAFAAAHRKIVDAAEKAGRDMGAYVLFMIIADETNELAEAKWKKYEEGLDEVRLEILINFWPIWPLNLLF